MNFTSAEFRAYHFSGLKVFLCVGVLLLILGCTQIWNASDLAVWVRDRAVEQGCQRDTIKLDEWYTQTADGNIWYGTCQDDKNNIKSVGVNVDQVWKPSESAN